MQTLTNKCRFEIFFSMKIYMVVNLMVREISRAAHNLARTLTVIKKENFIFLIILTIIKINTFNIDHELSIN
jgi:hypothetical protein